MTSRYMTYKSLITATFLVVTGSCSMMQDNRDNCPTCKNPLHVTLKYDYNLQRADMFNDHVGAATCYVVNQQNVIVAKQEAANTATAQPLRERSFAFNFEGLQPGQYQLYAIGAQRAFGELSSFTATSLDEGDDIRQLQLHVERDVTQTVTADLDTLWHGVTTAPVTVPEKQPAEATVSLMRDTKHLSLMLIQTTDPTENFHTDYEVSIADNNGLLDYDNSQLADATLHYQPYAAWTTETLDDNQDIIQRTAHYDLSFGRLFHHADDATRNARLHIRKADTGDNIVDIDLVYYLALARNTAQQRYDVQEFVDRGYDFRLDVILDGNQWRYMTISIDVLEWSIRIQNENL